MRKARSCKYTADSFGNQTLNEVIDTLLDEGATTAEITAKLQSAVTRRKRTRSIETAREHVRMDFSHVVHKYMDELYGEDITNEIPLESFWKIVDNLLDLLETKAYDASDPGKVKSLIDEGVGHAVPDAAEKVITDFVKKL